MSRPQSFIHAFSSASLSLLLLFSLGPLACGTSGSSTDPPPGNGSVSSPSIISFGTNASQQGAYSLDLSWAQLSQTQELSFATEEKRTLVAEFYNTAGQRTQRSIELRFHCRGEPACEGRCLNTGSLCPTSKDKLCIAGSCLAGCYVGENFTPADAMSSADACQVCKPATSRTALQTLPDYASCKPGFACGDGKCEVPFTRQDPKTASTLYSVRSLG